MVIFFTLMIALSISSCGQVKEDEASFAALPEGKRSTKYVDEDGQEVAVILGENGAPTIVDADGNPISEESGEVEQPSEDTPKIGLALAEMYRRGIAANDCSGSTCDFETDYQIEDAIVTYATTCSSCNNSQNREVWLHTADGKYGLYLWLTGNDGFTTAVNTGDKVSLTIKKFTVYFGLPEVVSIDSATVSIEDSSAVELWNLFNSGNSFESIDFDNLSAYPGGLYQGNFKVISGPSFGHYIINTVNYTGDAFQFTPSSSTEVTKGNCYNAKNAAFKYSFNTYKITEDYDLTTISEVTCSEVGL